MSADGITYLSTGAVADLLGVSTTTVLTLMDDGVLDGYTLPSGHRRIRRASISLFLGVDPNAAAAAVTVDRIDGGGGGYCAVCGGHLDHSWVAYASDGRVATLCSIHCPGVGAAFPVPVARGKAAGGAA